MFPLAVDPGGGSGGSHTSGMQDSGGRLHTPWGRHVRMVWLIKNPAWQEMLIAWPISKNILFAGDTVVFGGRVAGGMQPVKRVKTHFQIIILQFYERDLHVEYFII